jgi:hypothetical protein
MSPYKDRGFKITTTPLPDGKIVQTVDCIENDTVVAQITRRVLDTQEQQVRDALIALGWAPPTSI